MGRKKVKLNKTLFDTIAFSLVIVLTTLTFMLTKLGAVTNEPLFVYAYAKNDLIGKESLYVNNIVTYHQSDYPFFLADITLEIKDGKVRVEKEESPLKFCSIQGFVSDVAQPVVCLPNNFFFVIMGDSYATF